jgi:hypothetical protein
LEATYTNVFFSSEANEIASAFEKQGIPCQLA